MAKTKEERTGLYETTFIGRHDLSKQDMEKLMDEFSAIITEGKGKIVKKEYWGLRTLAYKINKHSKGHYAFLCLDCAAPALFEMERKMRLHDDVMRLLTVKVDTLDDNPSVMMKRADDDRDAA